LHAKTFNHHHHHHHHHHKDKKLESKDKKTHISLHESENQDTSQHERENQAEKDPKILNHHHHHHHKDKKPESKHKKPHISLHESKNQAISQHERENKAEKDPKTFNHHHHHKDKKQESKNRKSHLSLHENEKYAISQHERENQAKKEARNIAFQAERRHAKYLGKAANIVSNETRNEPCEEKVWNEMEEVYSEECPKMGKELIDTLKSRANHVQHLCTNSTYPQKFEGKYPSIQIYIDTILDALHISKPFLEC